MAEVSLWRIAKNAPAYRADDLSGAGAAAYGGRWNSKGKFVVYGAASIALATLETLAHLGDDIAARDRFLIQIAVPPMVWKRRTEIRNDSLQPGWQDEPPGAVSIEIGDAWIDNRTSALLVVPSVIIHEECNVLINPAHPDARRISASIVRPFIYDPRLR